MGDDKILTRWKQIAAHIGVCEKTARNLQNYGLPIQKLGKVIRITIRELDVWLDSKRKEYAKK